MPNSAMADLGDLETLALRRMPALEILWRASHNVPEPVAVNIDPAWTDAVVVPGAMPKVAPMTVPNVAIIGPSDDVSPVDVNGSVDVDSSINVDSSVDVNRSVDVGAPIDVPAPVALLRVCRRCDSDPKRGKDGKNDGSFS